MFLRTIISAFALFSGSFINLQAAAVNSAGTDFNTGFTKTVKPFLDSYCIDCHSGEKPKAQFDLSPYKDIEGVVRDHGHWALVLEKLVEKEMPPAKHKAQPTPESRQAVIDWIETVRKEEARKNAGDPGDVLARRLSNAEYNYSIRDLTGVDLRPTREFPVDPANPEGFDNTGESLAMSPALLNKYLQAAREVANHMVLKLDGIAFAPYPMLVETDRDKYCVNQIVDFYKKQNTDYADYFQTAWQFKHRAALGKPRAGLADFAAENQVSAKYLALVWKALEETKEEVGPMAKVQKMWRELPAPKANQPDLAREQCAQMRDFIVTLRAKLEPRFPNLATGGVGATSQPFLMWKNRQYASHRRAYDRGALQIDGKKTDPNAIENEPGAENEFGPGRTMPVNNRPGDPDLFVPLAQRAAYEASFARFSSLFPDAFYVSERGRNYLDKTRDQGRLLSAGFHNVMGYFRDDQPLYELILDEQGQRQLDKMWRELDFIASASIRTHIQHFFGESAEARNAARSGGFESDARPEDKEVISELMISRIKAGFLTRVRESSNTIALRAIEEHFDTVNASIRWVERARIETEPVHIKSLQDFAARAYRRPLTKEERDDLQVYYQSLRKDAGLPHEDAMRDALVYVLMSPDFCYRIDLVEAGQSGPEPSVRRRNATGNAAISLVSADQRPGLRHARPLSNYALASRLSYFLWSSIPDEQLLARAAAGELQNPEVLAAEARRMLKDERVRGLAAEFGGHWLDFRRFEEHNAVDRERFTTFDNELRQAMFEEPIQFMLHVFRENRSVLDFLYADYTFVNPALAKHYGMPEPKSEEWVRFDGAKKYERGGLLPMSVFLTQNAPGLRTSPVKRGYWVVKRVLGEHIPPPPAVVPELPRDEAKIELPLRELLAKHRDDPSCASCHARFDSFGLVFENYGPIGERREKDLAGRPVDIRAEFPGGAEGSGLAGLQQYIQARRQNDFLDNICRKMLAYALGRSLILSDETTVQEMRAKLVRDGYRFDSLIESVVTSPQFMHKRVSDQIAAN